MNLDEIKQRAKVKAEKFDLIVGGRVDSTGRRNELIRALVEFGKELLNVESEPLPDTSEPIEVPTADGGTGVEPEESLPDFPPKKPVEHQVKKRRGRRPNV